MSRAIIIKGLSGIGKSTVSSLIAQNHNYKHSDIDEFKWLFSHERSKQRTDIGQYMGYRYAKQLIKQNYNIIIEALPNNYLKKLMPYLKKQNYTILRISLQAPLEQCIKNNATRERKGYESKVIEEVYEQLLSTKGDIIDVTNKSAKQIYDIINFKYF